MRAFNSDIWLKLVAMFLVDRPTQLFCILDFYLSTYKYMSNIYKYMSNIYKHTNTKDIVGQSAILLHDCQNHMFYKSITRQLTEIYITSFSMFNFCQFFVLQYQGLTLALKYKLLYPPTRCGVQKS